MGNNNERNYCEELHCIFLNLNILCICTEQQQLHPRSMYIGRKYLEEENIWFSKHFGANNY